MNKTRHFPRPHPDTVVPVYAPLPLSAPGNAAQFAFTTMECLVGHYSQWLPPRYVNNIIETEKEVFVVRRDCSLQETRLQFIKKCEMALTRTLSDLQSGRTTIDWNMGTQAGH